MDREDDLSYLDQVEKGSRALNRRLSDVGGTKIPLEKLFEATFDHLHKIWDDVGKTKEQRRAILEKLSQEVAGVYNTLLQNQSNERRLLETQVEAEIQRLQDVAQILGEGSVVLSEDVISLPLYTRLELLKEHTSKLELRKQKRFQQLSSLSKDLQILCTQLAIENLSTFLQSQNSQFSEDSLQIKSIETDLSKENKEQFLLAIEFLRIEKKKREKEVDDLTVDLIGLYNQLETNHSEFDRSVLNGDHTPSGEWIEQLLIRKGELQQEKSGLESDFKEYSRKLNVIWDKLKVSEEEQELFYATHTGIKPSTLVSIKDEIRRMEKIRQDSLRVLIDNAREHLTKLWEELHFSTTDRLEFEPFGSMIISETILSCHEAEIIKLDNMLAQKRPILELIKKREEILEEKRRFEISSTDPSRLFAKGPGMAGRLLQEEHFRKEVLGKTLPKIEQKLIKDLSKWEQEHFKQFDYEGGSYIGRINEQKAAEQRLAEEKKNTRKGMNTSVNSGSNNNMNKSVLGNVSNVTHNHSPISTPGKKRALETSVMQTDPHGSRMNARGGVRGAGGVVKDVMSPMNGTGGKGGGGRKRQSPPKKRRIDEENVQY